MDNSEKIKRRFAGGDQKAFRKIFDTFWPKVYEFARRVIGNNDEAKDAAQKTFIQVWLNREKFIHVKNIDSYIFIIAKNTVLNHISMMNARKRKTVSYIPEIKSHNFPSNGIEMIDIRNIINCIVDKMPPQRKRIFLMSREEGLKNEEIAIRLGVTKKTVENHINLALREIKKELPKF